MVACWLEVNNEHTLEHICVPLPLLDHSSLIGPSLTGNRARGDLVSLCILGLFLGMFVVSMVGEHEGLGNFLGGRVLQLLGVVLTCFSSGEKVLVSHMTRCREEPYLLGDIDWSGREEHKYMHLGGVELVELFLWTSKMP